jgi:CheY-like chemotaxis protein
VGAFVAAPWSGRSSAPPAADPRGGEPEPVPEEKACGDGAGGCSARSTADAAAGKRPGVNRRLSGFANKQGSGLGLFVANLCVKEMGGTIGFRCAQDLEPEIGRPSSSAPAPLPRLGGSVFWFDVPFVPVNGALTSAQLESLESLKESLSSDLIFKGSASNSTNLWCKACHLSKDVFAAEYMSPKDDADQVAQPFLRSTSMPGDSGDFSGNDSCFDSDGSVSKSVSCEDMAAPEGMEAVPQAASRRPRVLVVDDSVMVQKLLCRSLAHLDIDTDTACNGREGLAKMKQSSYQAVLMDFLMPVMDGISATAEFRAWEQETHGADAAPPQNGSPGGRLRQVVIGISANAEGGDLESARKAGIDHFINKPVKVRGRAVCC